MICCADMAIPGGNHWRSMRIRTEGVLGPTPKEREDNQLIPKTLRSSYLPTGRRGMDSSCHLLFGSGGERGS